MNKLFPTPSAPPSPLSPRRWPGITPQSTATALATLKDNHERWHCFFNDQRFHNHLSHWVMAIWSLGAHESHIEAAYKLDSAYQRPAFKSPEAITSTNFWDHLGDEKYYAAYVEFFKSELEEKGIARILEEYILAPEANYRPDKDEENQPRMLDRFFSGLIHPWIFVGYGCEFGLPGMILEGLGQATAHNSNLKPVLSQEFLTTRTRMLENQPSRLTVNGASPTNNTHAFTIIGRMLKDTQFDNIEGPVTVFLTTTQKYGEAIKKYAAQWSFDASRPGELERKIEELIWMNTMIYGISGFRSGKHFNADFLLMHLVTSSLFLPSVAAYLSPSSAEITLRAYFTTSLAWWIATGRPKLNIREFFSAETEYLTPSGPLPIPHKSALPSEGSPLAVNPNSWLPIIETTIVQPDDHLPKLQRALSHYGTLYGSRQAGLPDFKETELEGADALDGTLFIRVAGLTAKRMGRIREGEEEPAQAWDRNGFWQA